MSKRHCDICEISVSSANYARHQKTELHRTNYNLHKKC